MSKRLLFLDFDGVLHDADAANIEYEGTRIIVTGDGLFLHAPALADALCGYPDVDVIISSSWRNQFPLAELVERLGVLGARVTDTTKESRYKWSCANRYAECAAYALDRQAPDWLMLDDQPEIVFGVDVPTPDQQAHLLVCDANLALGTPGVLPALCAWFAGRHDTPNNG